MIQKEIRVENALGIHARPASLIVQVATKFHCDISLEKEGASADAKSIMSVMMLAATHNSTIVIHAKGKDEAEAVAALEALFARKFNEE
jgi:phosphocarrier protein HPr